MIITLNDKEYNFDEEVTINQLLQNLNINSEKIAIERNLEVVPKSGYDQKLRDGDKLEVVHFIGGG